MIMRAPEGFSLPSHGTLSASLIFQSATAALIDTIWLTPSSRIIPLWITSTMILYSQVGVRHKNISLDLSHVPASFSHVSLLLLSDKP